MRAPMMRRSHQFCATAILVAAAAVSGDAAAVDHASHFAQGLELASGILPAGQQGRTIRLTTTQAPRAGKAALRAFEADVGGGWLSMWDESTGVPLRLWGRGIPAPNATSAADGKDALGFAKQILARHIALFAPGAAADDFVVAENVMHRGQRVVSFLQYAGGMRVVGGQLSFRFRNDRLYVIASEAMPFVGVEAPAQTLSGDEAAAVAAAWVEGDYGTASLESVEGPMVLPLVGTSRVHGYRVVHQVTLRTSDPIGRFDVFVDAVSGERVAREQTLMFATGSVAFNTPVRYPGSDRADFPARFVQALVDGQAVTADDQGVLAFGDPGPVTVEPLLVSQYAQLVNEQGPLATTSLSLDALGTAVWNDQDTPTVDAHLNAFIHTQIIKDYVRGIAPEMNWVNAQLPVHVNHNDTCNAFYDGSSINFYRHNSQCENTGRLADVVYHEFGHGVHHHAVILGSGDFDGALSEGVSDYLAATFTGDPGMGRGFFYSNAPLRHINPGIDKKWPDDIEGEVHADGEIIGGTLWDLRQLLVDKYGEAEGVAKANALYYGAIKNASDIPTMYVEVLAADDDDGNIENGTPNVCEIADAFARHGLRSLNVVSSSLSVEPPTQVGHKVSLEVEGLFSQCPTDVIEGATVAWHHESGNQTDNFIDMQGGPTTFEAEIPAQSDGQVIRYRVEVRVGGNTTISFPANEADPYYQFFVGQVTPIFCTDFEIDPNTQGWTHGLIEGQPDEGADDWQWDTPNGTAQNGDPMNAYSGSYVFGNDLGHGNYNGLYQRNKTNYADSPIIDTSGYDNVRLQYRRWLNSEDGHFDQGSIYANGQLAWTNHASPNENNAEVHHTDREWRFHDVDLAPFIGDDGTVQIRFQMASDGGLQMGGWTIDDFCIVSYEATGPSATCGNGTVEVGEACDDGNTAAGDGCDAICQPEETNDADDEGSFRVADSGCGCVTAGGGARDRGPWLLLGLGLAAVALRRRRWR